MTKYARTGIGTLTLLMICALGPVLLAKDADEHVIINTPKPYTSVVNAIQKLGGKVERQFQYIDAISVDIPSSALLMLVNVPRKVMVASAVPSPEPVPLASLNANDRPVVPLSDIVPPLAVNVTCSNSSPRIETCRTHLDILSRSTF